MSITGSTPAPACSPRSSRRLPTADDPFAAVWPRHLGVDFSSDQAGGFATPNLGVSTLSRELGPLAGKVADAVTDTFDPSTFFPDGTADAVRHVRPVRPAGRLQRSATGRAQAADPIARHSRRQAAGRHARLGASGQEPRPRHRRLHEERRHQARWSTGASRSRSTFDAGRADRRRREVVFHGTLNDFARQRPEVVGSSSRSSASTPGAGRRPTSRSSSTRPCRCSSPAT